MPSILLQLLKHRERIIGVDLPCNTLGPGWARDIGTGRFSAAFRTRSPALRAFTIGTIALPTGMFAASARRALAARLATSLATFASSIAPAGAGFIPATRARGCGITASRPSGPAPCSTVSGLETEDVE